MGAATVKAKWVGPFRAEMPRAEGVIGPPTELVPGETVVELPKAEAEADRHWQVVGGSGGSKSKGSKGSKSTGSKGGSSSSSRQDVLESPAGEAPVGAGVDNPNAQGLRDDL